MRTRLLRVLLAPPKSQTRDYLLMITRILIAILLFVPFADLAAQDSIHVDNYLVDTSPSGGLLGIPRQQVMPLTSGEVVVFVAGWRGKNLFVSSDLSKAQPWGDTLSMSADPQISEADIHTHFSVDRDTIYAVLPLNGGDSLLVKVIGCHGDSLWNIDYSYTRGYQAPGGWSNMTVYRGGAWFIPGTDSLIMISRGHDGTGNDYMDVMSFVSPDRGRTWGDSIRVVDLINAQDQTRVGGINYFNHTVTALIFSREESGVLWYDWNRTTRQWQSGPENPLTGNLDRGYSGNVIEDTIQFVTCCNSASNSRDSVYYAWKTRSQTSWNRGAFEAGTLSSNQWIHTNLCYVESSHRLVLFYQQHYASALDSTMVYCRYWERQQQRWSEPVLVSTGRGVVDMSPALRTPASHGDVAYLSYHQRDAVTGVDEIELARVTFSGQQIDTCKCVGLVGDVDCDGGEQPSLGDLTALIDHLFITLRPVCCPSEAEIDGDPGISLGDLTAMIDHLFVSLRPPRACP